MAKLKNVVKELNEASEDFYLIGDGVLTKSEAVDLLARSGFKKTTVRCGVSAIDRSFSDSESLSGRALGATFSATAHRILNGSAKL